MPESRRIGLDNPHLAARVRTPGRSADFVRRSVQPQIRRSIDGFALPKPAKTVINDVQASRPKQPTRSINNRHTGYTSKPALPRQARSVVLARHAPNTKAKKRRKRSSKQTRVSFLLVSMAVMVFIAGGVVSYLGWKTNRKAAAQVDVLSSSTENESGDVPVEEEITPDVLAVYQVAPDMPRFIKIPRLGVDARVKRLGVKLDGSLGAPANVNDAGWYDGSSKPGENGTVLIDGHVHGPTKHGVFYRLASVKPGDTIEIERGDGIVITYQVVSLENVDQDKVDMAKALTSVEPSKPGLNIITCTGRYDIRTNKYEQRLVVYAVQQ